MNYLSIIAGKIQSRTIECCAHLFQLIFRRSLTTYIVVRIPGFVGQPVHGSGRTAAVNDHIADGPAAVHTIQRHLRTGLNRTIGTVDSHCIISGSGSNCALRTVQSNRIGAASQRHRIIQIHLIVRMTVYRCRRGHMRIGTVRHSGSGFDGRCIQLTAIYRIRRSR